MSWTSASVGPSGRQIASRSSTTESRPRSCVCQDASSLMSSGLQGDVEALHIEVVVGSELVGAQAELLGRVAMRPVGAGAVLDLPRLDDVRHRGRELAADELVHATHL